jgi:hypothetical protein
MEPLQVEGGGVTKIAPLGDDDVSLPDSTAHLLGAKRLRPKGPFGDHRLDTVVG